MLEALAPADKEYLSLLGSDGNLNKVAPQVPLLSDREILARIEIADGKGEEQTVAPAESTSVVGTVESSERLLEASLEGVPWGSSAGRADGQAEGRTAITARR